MKVKKAKVKLEIMEKVKQHIRNSIFLVLILLFGFQTVNYIDKKGRKQGKHITCYPNGKIETIGNYRNDTLDGKSFRYYDNGQMQLEMTFSKGVAIDTYKNYMENGYMNFLYVFKDTFKIWILLDVDGTVLQQENQGYFKEELEKRKFLELQKSKVK